MRILFLILFLSSCGMPSESQDDELVDEYYIINDDFNGPVFIIYNQEVEMLSLKEIGYVYNIPRDGVFLTKEKYINEKTIKHFVNESFEYITVLGNNQFSNSRGIRRRKVGKIGNVPFYYFCVGRDDNECEQFFRNKNIDSLIIDAEENRTEQNKS